MARKLDFIQIIFDESQRDKCYPFATVYFNNELTDYFENSVIAKIVPELDGDYISVCSWRLAQKRGGQNPSFIYLNGKIELSEEKILSHDFDVAVLTPRSPRHKALEMASQWHGEAWAKAFYVFQNMFLPTVGIKINGELKTAIYENHFIAKKEIYHDYVKNILRPAIAFMDSRDVFRENSGYRYKKRDEEEVKRYQQRSGREDWPIGCFILERLFSIYINDKPHKIINL